MTKAISEWTRCRPWIEAALEAGPQLESIEDIERKTEMIWVSKNRAASLVMYGCGYEDP